MHLKRMLMLVGLVAALAVLAGALSAGADAKKSGGTFVIGYSGGFTGALSFYDTPIGEGMQLAVDELNAKGGVEGYKFKLIKNDNKTDATLFVSQAKAMLAQKPTVFNSGCSYGTAAPGSRVANAAGVLNFGCSGPTIFGLKGVGPLTFNTWHGDPTEAAVLGAFIQQKGWKRGYWLTTNFDYNIDISNLLKGVFKGDGGTISGEDTFKITDVSFDSQITKLRAAAAKLDFIWVSGLSTGAPQLIKQIRDAGINLPILGAGGSLSGDYWLKSVPGLTNYYDDEIGSVFGDDKDPAKNSLIARFIKRYHTRPPTGHVFVGYSEVQAIAEALKMAGGKTDSQSLKKALESFRKVQLLAGPTTYTPTCHVPTGRTLAIMSVVNGKRHFVEYITPKKVPAATC